MGTDEAQTIYEERASTIETDFGELSRAAELRSRSTAVVGGRFYICQGLGRKFIASRLTHLYAKIVNRTVVARPATPPWFDWVNGVAITT